MLPKKLQDKLDKRKEENSLRLLGSSPLGGGREGDFSSNDYLGFTRNKLIFNRSGAILDEHHLKKNGATGSRLLSGNHKIYQLAEDFIAKIHKVASALIFNSGYDANVGFFSSVPQRGDVILYDEYIHASIRDGLQMSQAKAYKFQHNNLEDLEKKLKMWSQKLPQDGVVYVVTESVFSMDGDSPQLQKMTEICSKHDAKLIVDEAHALGVFGVGLIDNLALGHRVFARLVTFGKAMGCHGAAILGNADLKTYLVNFARSFIYTTGLPPHGVAAILAAYEHLESCSEMNQLGQNIKIFKLQLETCKLQAFFIPSNSAIQSAVIPGNIQVKSAEKALKSAGFEVKSILSPTVPRGQERLRFCLHSYNTEGQITQALKILCKIVNNLPPLGRD